MRRYITDAPSNAPDGYWIAMDRDGEWWVYSTEPDALTVIWLASSNGIQCRPIGEWTPPEVDNWRESKFFVNRKANETSNPSLWNRLVASCIRTILKKATDA